jgi:hypothetical protein
MTIEPHGQDCDEDSADERIEHLFTGIELQMLLIPGTNAGDTNDKNRGYFTPYQITVIIDKPPLDTVVDVTENTSPIVKKFRVDGILKELYDKG